MLHHLDLIDDNTDESVQTNQSQISNIDELITTHQVYAVSDASVKHNQMTGYWAIVNHDNYTIKSKEIYHKSWHLNGPTTAESIVCLDMLENIFSMASEEIQGEIVVIIDCKKLYNQLHGTWDNLKRYVSDSSATISRIREIVRATNVELAFQLVTGYKKKFYQFNKDPTPYLMKWCDREAKRVMQTIHNMPNETNITHYGTSTLMVNNQINDRPVRDAIRICDAMNSRLQCI